MSNQSNGKTAAVDIISSIHKVEGFDPAALAVEYTDLNSGEKRKRLPVMAQIAWFRLVFPEGKISVNATPVKDHYVAHAKVYKNYMDPPDHFLSEATASRTHDPANPTVSPREWAQTAAIGVALRNAGFGLQFHAAGDAFDHLAVDERGELMESPPAEGVIIPQTGTGHQTVTPQTPAEESSATTSAQPEESPLERATKMICPLTKDGLKGKTLGELITLDPGALTWIANKYTKDPAIAEGARLICEHALNTVA